jgi:hypothetical protein
VKTFLAIVALAATALVFSASTQAMTSTESTGSGQSQASVRWFRSPSGNIECQVEFLRRVGGRLNTEAMCQTFEPIRSVTLYRGGRIRVCRGLGCVGNGPENAFTLRYGHSMRLGLFRCTSLRMGMRCVVVGSGHGFLISREALKRF